MDNPPIKFSWIVARVVAHVAKSITIMHYFNSCDVQLRIKSVTHVLKLPRIYHNLAVSTIVAAQNECVVGKVYF